MGASTFRWYLSAQIIFLTAACTKVPNLNVDQESIRILDVVKRVKCDLYYAVSTERETPNGPVIVPISRLHDFAWLSKWVMQVNLNLIVNDQSGLTPGVTLIDPLRPVTLTGIGSFSQMYSTGIGGGANTTAQRTETISFSLSFAEVEAELRSGANQAKYDYCNLNDGVDLDADLKLKEWIWSSMAPIQEEYLKPGHHKAPKAAATSSPAAAGAKALAGSPAFVSFQNLKVPEITDTANPPLSEKLGPLVKYIQDTISLVQRTWNETKADDSGKPVPGAVSDKELKNVFQHEGLAIEKVHEALSLIRNNPNDKSIDDYIANAPPINGLKNNKFDRDSFTQYLQSIALLFEWDLSLFRLSQSKDSTPDQITSLIAKVDSDIALANKWQPAISEKVLKELRTIRGELTTALNSFDPPIDSLSHQVQFIVAWSGNISPSWSLVKFRGPSPSSGPLLSGSSSNTHTLSIVLGPPNADTANALTALQIGNSVQSALNNTTVRVTLPP